MTAADRHQLLHLLLVAAGFLDSARLLAGDAEAYDIESELIAIGEDVAAAIKALRP